MDKILQTYTGTQSNTGAANNNCTNDILANELSLFLNIFVLFTIFSPRSVEASIKHHSVPPDGAEALKFDSTYSQDKLSQFFTCLWKQTLVYWRSPHYNAMRLCFTTIAALIFGSVFWDIGMKRSRSPHLNNNFLYVYAECV